jgi:hypothetical protein
LYTGNPIFDGKDEFDQMQKFISVLGMPSNSMIEKMSIKKRKKFFDEVEKKFLFKNVKF